MLKKSSPAAVADSLVGGVDISICLVVVSKYLLVYMSCICNMEVSHFKELESIMPNRDSLQSTDFMSNLI